MFFLSSCAKTFPGDPGRPPPRAKPDAPLTPESSGCVLSWQEAACVRPGSGWGHCSGSTGFGHMLHRRSGPQQTRQRPRSGRAGFVFEPGRWVIRTPGRRLYRGRRGPSQHLPADFHAEGLVRARERRQAGSPHAEGWPALTKGPAGGSQSRPTRRVPGPTATRGRATHSKGYSTRASCAPSGRGSATGPEKAQASSPRCPIAGRTPVPMMRAPPGGHRVRHRRHSLLVAQWPRALVSRAFKEGSLGALCFTSIGSLQTHAHSSTKTLVAK